MNFKALYQKPIAGIKWVATWTVNTVKWNIKQAIRFTKWNKDQIVAVLKGTWNLIVSTVKLIAKTLKDLGRFWIGIGIISYGVLKASGSSHAFVAFLNGNLTAKMADGGIAYGLGMMIVGMICILASPDYSKLTDFIKKG